MPNRILVTGGSGFIGSEVVRIALERGYDVLNLDIEPPRIDSHREFWKNIDIRDGKKFTDAAVAFLPDRLLHLASDTDISIQSIEEFSTITEGTKNVLDVVAILKDLKTFIHVSTQFTVRPGVEAANERFYDPYTVYGEAKALSEDMVWQQNIKADWYILRPTIIWGPHHPTFANEIFRHIRQGTYLHPKGSKPIFRAFGYVTNVAAQILDFSVNQSGKTNRRVFYLGDETIDYDLWADAFAKGTTGKPAKRIPVSVLRILGFLGDMVKITGIKSPIDSGRAFRMTTSSEVDLEPMLSLVGPPLIDFEQGVEETLVWLKEVYGGDKIES